MVYPRVLEPLVQHVVNGGIDEDMLNCMVVGPCLNAVAFSMLLFLILPQFHTIQSDRGESQWGK